MDVVDIWRSRSAALVEAQCERDYFMNEVKEARERIRKAKAILEGFRVSTFGHVAAPVIDDALEALEGK